MQHFGAPTRLLDWTASLFVALYFAARGHRSDDGAVYLVHVSTLNAAMHEAYGKAAELGTATDDRFTDAAAPETVHLVERKTALPRRMTVQQGGFMLCENIHGDIESILAERIEVVADEAKELHRKLIVPAALKPEIMRRLREMNVTRATLFPDLDGVGGSLNEMVMWR